MTCHRLPATVAAHEDIGKPFPPTGILPVAAALSRAPASDNRGVADDLHLVVVLSKRREFHLARFPSCENFSSRRQPPIRIRGHKLWGHNALEGGGIVRRIGLLPVTFELEESLLAVSCLSSKPSRQEYACGKAKEKGRCHEHDTEDRSTHDTPPVVMPLVTELLVDGCALLRGQIG